MLKQISINLPNRPGKLAEISDLMGSEGLNMRAVQLDDHGDMSTMRVIVEDPDKAVNLLTSKSYDFHIDDVLAVEVPDHPGGLGAVLKPLRDSQINIKYLYPAIGRHGSNAILILGPDKKDEAIKVLKQNYILVLEDEVYRL